MKTGSDSSSAFEDRTDAENFLELMAEWAKNNQKIIFAQRIEHNGQGFVATVEYADKEDIGLS